MFAKIVYLTAFTLFIVLVNIGSSKSLILLGNVGNTWYEAETTLMNWAAAKAYCKAHFSRQAAKFSNSQINFLKNAYNRETFSGTFWTAGRDAGTPAQFVWDKTWADGVSAGDVTGFDLIYSPPPLTCLFFHASGPSNGGFGAQPCTALAGVLCESEPTRTDTDFLLV